MSGTVVLDEPSTKSFSLDQYAPLVGAAEIDELRALAAPLKGRRVQMVNSTAVGGGVAEILSALLPLMGEIGLATSWDVLAGGQDFFEVTKAFHNALHGEPYRADAPLRNFSRIHRAKQETPPQRVGLHRDPRSPTRRTN